MDKQMSRWVIEFVIRKGIDDRLLERLIAILPLDDLDFRSKKFLLLRRIQTEVSKGTVSEKILDLLEIVAELELSEPKVPSETMRAAYCAVAVGCTVKFLELEDTNMYSEALQRIWRCRVPEVGKCDISGLISDKLLSWKDDLEAASSSVEIRNKVMSKNTIYEALKAVKCYVAELWNEMGPSFLEKTAELVYKKGKSVQELNSIGDEGLENVTEAHNAVTPTERPSVGNEILPSVQELNPIGDEGLEKLTEAHNAVTPTERPSVGNEILPSVQELNPIGDEGLENVTEAHNAVTPTERPSVGNEILPSVQELNPIGDEGLEKLTEAHNAVTPTERPSVGNEILPSVQELNPIGDEGLENVTEAHNAVTPTERPSVGNEVLPSVQELNPIGDEGLENVTEAHNAVTPTERPSVGNEILPSVQELNPIGDEGLENVTEAHNVVTPTERPSVETPQKKGPQKRKHVGGHKKSFNKSGSKARISNVEELDIGTRMNQYPSFPTPEVNKVQTDLESSFVDLNAVVRDPLPEALKIAEEASSDIQRDTGGVDGNSGGEMNLDSTPKGRTDGVEANTIENIRDNDHPQGEERPNGNPSSTIDPLEFSEESLPNRPHLRNPRRTVISPLKIYSFPKIEKRRQKRKWTVLEEDTLRKGVQNFGRGNWKAILMEYRDIFEERTEVDLKDKWRNLTRYSS